MGHTKTLWIRQPYLDQILTGKKTVEVRVGYDNIRSLNPGDRLRLNDRYLATVRRIGRYGSFEELLTRELPAAVAPELEPEQLPDALRQIYPPEKEALGVMALELKLDRYDTILFDVGYTLVFFDPLQDVIVQKSLAALGAERSLDEIDAAAEVVWGAYYQDVETVTFPATAEYDHQTQLSLIRGLMTELGLRDDDQAIEAYYNEIESWYMRPGGIRPYPEVHEVLAALQGRGYRLGIVSNWSWNLRERVEQVGLAHYFEAIWASAYAGCNKPHPEVFHQALSKMQGPEPSPDRRVLYVGDSYVHDVVGARNAGLDVVLVDRSGTAGEVDCPVIKDLRGLMAYLSQ